MVRLASLEALPVGREGEESEDLFVYPLEECTIQLDQLLTRNVRQNGPPLSFVHQIPHGRYGRLPPALVCHLGIIGYEMKFTAAVVQAALLDFMATHERLAGVNALREGRWLRASSRHRTR